LKWILQTGKTQIQKTTRVAVAYHGVTDGKKKKGKQRSTIVDKKTVDLVSKIFDNLNNEQREKNIREIASMVADNNKKKHLAKLANMVKNNVTCRRQRQNYRIEDRDIRELARLVRENKNINVPRTTFSIRQIRTHQRFGYNEYIFDINVGSENMRTTLPDFLTNLRKVFQYLINTMKYYAESDSSKARFYILNAPRTPFSTAILNVSDFETEMFFNIFERHMQSNAQEIINNGWHTTVSLYIFPNSYAPRQNKKKVKNNLLCINILEKLMRNLVAEKKMWW
jgi:hypothetical protein